MKAVICDLDGTLFDCQHRLHHVSGHKKNWDAFFEGIPDDPVVEPVLAVVRALSLNNAIVVTTGRPEKCRQMTEAKLDDNAVPYNKMYMRPDNDIRADHIVKAEILQKIKDDGYNPFLSIDDRQSVVDMWRDSGICTLQCAPHDDLGPATGVLTLLIGPSGAGKTTWLGYECVPDDEIVGSDRIRHQLCGDFRDQSRNSEVFAAVHAVAKARIMHGLNATVDATNIRRADRLSLVALARGGPVRYLVFDRPLEAKRKTGGWRNEIVLSNGKGLIEAHDQTFKSNLKDILNGDGMPNVTVIDHMDYK